MALSKKDDVTQGTDRRHASDEILERYSMGRLAEPELDEFESHLLLCAYCQEALAYSESYLTGVRSAGRELRRKSPSEIKPIYRRVMSMSARGWMATAAAFAALIIAGDHWRSANRAGGAPSLVVLESTRGSETAAGSSTQPGKPFVLMLDLTDLQPLPHYKLEIVDARGSQVFESDPAASNSTLRAAVSKGFPAGFYYVRLYDRSRDLLREYALKIAD